MNTISSIISILNTEERREFISLLKKKNKRNDTKNVALFKLLESNHSLKDVDLLLYKKPSKGAYHALSKRLYDSLIDFIASKSFKNEANEEIEALKLLVVSRIFFEHKQYLIGFKIIEKAERNAEKFGLYSILNEIHYTKIQYASHHPNFSLELLIKDFKANQQLLKQEENFTLFYATVIHQIQLRDQKLTAILEHNFSKFNISISENLSYKSFFTLLEIITNTANINRDYETILPFVEKTYRLLKKEKRLLEKQLFYHIQIIYYVANSHFRNRDFTTSQHYLLEMHALMLLQEKKYFNRFLPQYTLLQSLILNFTGKALKAIDILEQFNLKQHSSQLSYVLDLQLSLIVFYFQQTHFKKSLQMFNQLQHSDTWYTKKASNLWVIQKNLIELLIYTELEYIDLLESRLKSFSKKHLAYLQNNDETEVISFFKIISKMYYNQEYSSTKEFKLAVKLLKAPTNLKNKDLFYLSFYAWLKAKPSKSNLYNTTLNLLK